MKLALASKKFINNNIKHNLQTIFASMESAKKKNVDFVCFGEAFLQGFDALKWRYEIDKDRGLSLSSQYILEILIKSKELSIGLMFGYIEREEENLYSSYLVIDSGEIIHNYRRISKGWKNHFITDFHYKEGTDVIPFNLKGKKVLIAICGDLWDYPERFKLGQDLLIWPVYLNYDIDEWINREKKDYCLHANKICKNVVLINSFSDNPVALGGCYYFKNGSIAQLLEMGIEDLLIIEY
ncbi:MAG: carbon-nitrogen hydrolase family protein [Bacilli bacterium]|nr:carbon-nitrogen hydrolase family protein [Bacilli bacterium]